MKHTFKITVMLAAVLMLAACNKENEEPLTNVTTTHERDITYSMTDRTTTVHLMTDAEFDALLEQFCDYAQEGNSVTFYNANRTATGAKEVITYSTASREDMVRWMRQMEDAGMTVTVIYDHNTDTWNGSAYKTGPKPIIDSNYWVDLDLPSGLLWASYNVGASSPEERGAYFAWGETTPKRIYSRGTYAYAHDSVNRLNLTKYCGNSHYGYNGYTDTLTILEPCDDAASANIGGKARTPTILEWIELVDNTTSRWDTLYTAAGKRVAGIRFISTNGNSIFLPSTGYISQFGDPQNTTGRCLYWSASLDIPSPGGAYYFQATSSGIDIRYPELSHYRHIGTTVRPVRSAQ